MARITLVMITTAERPLTVSKETTTTRKDGLLTLWGSQTNGWDNPGFSQQDDCPVVCVNWEDANLFCAWLTRKEHAEGIISSSRRYRLPTDAEWSIAAGLE